MSQVVGIIQPNIENIEIQNMYFYNVAADCQDRELELSTGSINLESLAGEQEAIVADTVRMSVNVSILIAPKVLEQVDGLRSLASNGSGLDSYLEQSKKSNVVSINSSQVATESYQDEQINDAQVSVTKQAASGEIKIDPIQDAIDKLFAGFIGMPHLKEEIYRQASFLKIQQMRAANNIAVAISPSKHMVFKGNPGTGKTTVARIIADVFYKLGVLKTNKVVETDRSGLIAEYLGQTAIKTKAVIESAIDGVLFIDEAYSLTEHSNEYGNEAIDTLVKMMEDHRDNLVVIVAGYADEMDGFITSNPGLKSRFNRYMKFPDYSEEDLWEILLKLCKDNRYIIQDQTLLKPEMLKEFRLQKNQQGGHFGNARYIPNLFEKAIENQFYRLIKESVAD